jgi:hypothetical protein
VRRDVLAGKVTPAAARDIYGFVTAADGSVDSDGTQKARTRLRRERAGLEGTA